MNVMFVCRCAGVNTLIKNFGFDVCVNTLIDSFGFDVCVNTLIDTTLVAMYVLIH